MNDWERLHRQAERYKQSYPPGTRVMFYMDEFGTLPAISSAEMMYSASRSRKLSLVSIIQSYKQLEKNYGNEGADIIKDNCQVTIAGGFAPTSGMADEISKSLGTRTVMTGSVSRSKNDPSQSLQMTERPLMTADELKSMKKGNFIVMKTGTHPFISKLKLFFKWGIEFDTEKYTVPDKGARKVSYTNKEIIENIQKVEQINRQRKYNAPHHKLDCESYNAVELERNPSLALSYIAAPPRMAYYMEYSTRIYNIYLKYIAPEDIHVYSIDEVFIDLTHYLSTYKCTAKELAQTMIKDVLANTGITATAGIGTNMYLAKIAMDITAKKMPADENGVRIAELDEMSYRKELWTHKPLTDFWMLGSGIAKKLEANYMYTMGDVARCSHYDEAKLFKLFGVNAELIIDRAWGWEPTTIADIKAYKPSSNSLSVGQVLKCPYNYEKTKLIVREMIDQHVLDLVDKGLVTDQIVLDIGYDIENLTDPKISARYHGDVTTDRYGRKVPKHAHGTANLEKKTSSSHIITEATINLFDRIINKDLLVRRITVATCKLVRESDVKTETVAEQISLFDDPVEKEKKEQAERQALEQEKQMQKTIIGIKRRFGKNAILKGMNFQEGATARERNEQVGGHKA